MYETFALLGTALLAAGAVEAPGGDKPFPLMVGDPAPSLEVREWVKGEPLASFADGTTYVVEFWATWCGPCRKAIPHLSELQAQYDDVRFVGVSIWETLQEGSPSPVAAFVARMGDQMAYTVGADRTRADQEAVAAETWMEAAGQRGIPTAFVVDGNGTVAWIGSPFTIDEPLAEIAAGTWDLDAAAERHAEAMSVDARANEVAEELAAAEESGRHAQGLAALDAAVADHPELERRFALKRYALLRGAGRTEDAERYGRELVETLLRDEWGSLNVLAWGIVDPASRAADADLELARLAARRANELTDWKNPAVLDTYGLALFLAGDVEEAVSIQEKAVEHAVGTPYEEGLKRRLEEFRQEASART